ncbi:MAG: DUF4845 domain-containing protein [Gammaproteobacteria bacterium]|nr:DUF4845 domain-containing protein [Gammaproteobacteria bacterium]MCW8909063.1 DUF4845 domain-containing protein [Gammaproteobacteria bacterium]MCW9004554.1 DUF4845 domain-containing protein [Gammaproteobacteria bacterium]MCW9055961.1 DUF4845 domain-containing protein [Gammaproteobacteria bacterium]
MIKRQRGLTAIAWIIVIGLVAVQGLMALRIIPVYMNHNSVKSIVDSLKSDPDIKGKTPKQINSMISKRLEVNNLAYLMRTKDTFQYKRSDKGFKLKVHIEEKGPVFGNLNFLVIFDHEVNLPTR